MKSIDDLILEQIQEKKLGSIFFISDFSEMGSDSAIRVALHRMVKKGILIRAARGMYALPKTSQLLNTEIRPDLTTIAKAIARRDKAKIMPTGSYALHALGLSTQIPLNAVYYTDGTPRKIKIGTSTITFKKVSPKTLSYRGEISSLVILAMKEIGKDKLTVSEEERILILLKKENIEDLKHDIQIAPQWIGEFMTKSFRK